MLPPFMIDGKNTAEVFLSNMDYAQVSAAVVVQEFIDGLQNDYLATVSAQYPNRFITCGMADYLHDGFYEQALQLMAVKDFKGMAIPGHRLLGRSLTSPEMMRMFHEMERRNVFLSITLADGDRQVAELPGSHQRVPTTSHSHRSSWHGQSSRDALLGESGLADANQVGTESQRND